MESSIYESSKALVFIPDQPINKGHLIIRPLQQYKSMDELPPPVLKEVLKITQVAVRIIKQFYNAPGYSMMQNGALEDKDSYFEIHVFPRWDKKDFHWIYGPDDPEAYKIKKLKSIIENDFRTLINEG